ncbi:hypothetical protein AQS8620_02325 [Aquimixticola soesokkakensis]|uniref:UPF0102 protein AQS8620_02325 n=1 Tax=Aquimixticola soesokkakensis TaxID=1519096 RepID=A0A1Y5T066_9RHOB|nr:YraN family protein [Aquimixticola soesokkakensis]SLN53176.1 hypothetical protein AQS8620_02325 [Aquimixticola soesokkakensis]
MVKGPDSPNAARGAMAHAAGWAAEDIVARDYAARGGVVLERRWRGQGGEIDLIVTLDGVVVFVEVKQSRSFDSAATHLTARQIARLFAAGEEFLGTRPQGLLTDCRFDLALVDGIGAVQILENAFM